ncbi:erythromycin resistance leader peptide [Bacillales bacterium AN1005]
MTHAMRLRFLTLNR